MSKAYLFNNVTVINEGRRYTGSVLVEEGRIKHIVEGVNEQLQNIENPPVVIDGTGKLLLPGIIDSHVHFRDPGLTHKADMSSESRAAAAGGVTSFMDMPNCVPQTTTLEALADKFENAAINSHINYSFYLGATVDNTSLFAQLSTLAHRPCAVKIFLGSSTGNMSVNETSTLETVFREAAKYGLLLAAHCEDDQIIANNLTRKKHSANDIKALVNEIGFLAAHATIRSKAACLASSALAISLSLRYGTRFHLLHLTTKEELQLLAACKGYAPITAEACLPHILSACDDDCGITSSYLKCNPALKWLKDREALRQAIASGLVDTVATDHAPHLPHEKKGTYEQVPSGIPSVQFSLPAMLTLCNLGIFNYEQIVEKMCHAPTRLFGVQERGYIREGYKADLVLVQKKEWTVQAEHILSKCGWSPFEGRTLSHQVELTMVNGEIAYREGSINDDIRGEALTFH